MSEETLASTADDSLETGKVIAGRYVVGRRLESRGASDIYEGLQRNLGRRITIKVLDPGPGLRATVDHLWREARVLARLEHPCFVRVLDVGLHHGRPYVVREHAAGSSLASRLAEGRRFTWRETADAISDLASAVAHAHREGLGLGAPDTSGIWVTREGRFLIAELGGHPPEPRDGGELPDEDVRRDLHALGAIAYQMMSEPVANVATLAGRSLVSLVAVPEEAIRFCDLMDGLLADDEARAPESAEALVSSLEALTRGPQDVGEVDPTPAPSEDITRGPQGEGDVDSTPAPSEDPPCEEWPGLGIAARVMRARRSIARAIGTASLLVRRIPRAAQAAAGAALVLAALAAAFAALSRGPARSAIEAIDARDPRASSLVLEARAAAERRSYGAAIEHYEEAIRIDRRTVEDADVELLVRALKTPDKRSVRAARLLEAIGGDAVPPLRAVWEDPKAGRYHRRRSGEVLASLGEDVDLVPLWIDTLASEHCGSRRLAVKKLVELRDERGLTPLRSLASERGWFKSECGADEAEAAAGALEKQLRDRSRI